MYLTAATKFKLNYWWAISLPVFVFDHICKSIFTAIINPGVSFGLGANVSNNLWLVGYLVICLLAVNLLSRKQESGRIVITLMALSASNIIDRLVIGGVRDYVSLFGLYFNLTDVAINLFILWVVFVTLRTK